MKRRLSRRSFLSRTALGCAGLLILEDSRSALAAPANSRINVALLGVGGRGTWFVETMPRMENVAAICDINEAKVAEALKTWAGLAERFAKSPHDWERNAAPLYKRLTGEKPKVYVDFRELMSDKGIDAVIVALPDHTHAVASAAAIRAGKHVYCEKPLTRAATESRALRGLARQFKVATSMGNQGTAAGPFRRALELIREGRLGEVREVHIWNNGGGADRKEPPGEPHPVPNGFNWDLWLGPARFRPFHPDWLSRHLWREFGTNNLGNWGPHTVNLAFMALKVHELWGDPAGAAPPPRIRVEAKTSGINRLSFPRWEVVRWDIPARGALPPISFTWHNGSAPEMRKRLEGLLGEEFDWGDKKEKKWADWAGLLVMGTEGKIYATGHNATFRFLPEEKFKGVDRESPKTVEPSRGHEADWLEACRGGKPAWANFEYAVPLNEFLMLGNVATQFDRVLEYDPVECRIANDPEADRLLRHEYREGWAL